jgi:hypothetical protein
MMDLNAPSANSVGLDAAKAQSVQGFQAQKFSQTG